MENSEDLALETLLAVRAEVAPELDEELLRRAYEIQKKHQFTRDRSHSVQMLDRLIEEQVKALLEGSSDKGAAS